MPPAIEEKPGSSRRKKREKVLEKAYDPRRLPAAWQQAKRNTTVAGLDRTVKSARRDYNPPHLPP